MHFYTLTDHHSLLYNRKEHLRRELTVFCLAALCRTAVKNPVGKVKPDNQNTMGAWAEVAHFSNWSIRWIRSRVQEDSGFWDEYAWRVDRVVSVGHVVVVVVVVGL